MVLLAIRFHASGEYWLDDEMRSVAAGFGLPAVQRLHYLEGLEIQKPQREVAGWQDWLANRTGGKRLASLLELFLALGCILTLDFVHTFHLLSYQLSLAAGVILRGIPNQDKGLLMQSC